MTVPMRSCDHCGALLPRFTPGEWTSCSACGSALQIFAFPAAIAPISAEAPADTAILEDEARCFFHEDKRATHLCHRCGRFLCSLCTCAMFSEDYCGDCIAQGLQGSWRMLEQRVMRYDLLALGIALLPYTLWMCLAQIIFPLSPDALRPLSVAALFFPSIITAPLAAFLALRYWRQPGGLTNTGRHLFVAALGLSVLQLFGWFTLIAFGITFALQMEAGI